MLIKKAHLPQKSYLVEIIGFGGNLIVINQKNCTARECVFFAFHISWCAAFRVRQGTRLCKLNNYLVAGIYNMGYFVGKIRR